MNLVRPVLPILLLLLGLVFLGLSSKISFLPPWSILIAAFTAYNIFVAIKFGLTKKLRETWGPARLPAFFPGVLIGLIPWLSAYAGDVPMDLNHVAEVSVLRIYSTLMIVIWEEMWFRGMPFEMAIHQYGWFKASLIFAAAFVLLHVMNPDINLMRAGIGLFLAGYSLSLCYLAFGSLWASVGMHFANNILSAQLVGIEGGVEHTLGLATVAIALTAYHYKESPE